MSQFSISTKSFAAFEKKVKAMGRKGFTVKYTATHRFETYADFFGREDEDHEGVMIEIVDIDLEEGQFCQPMAGFKMVAVIDHRNNMVTQLDRAVDVEPYRHRHVCDHCGTRRPRSKTCIMQNIETGELMQVGTSCLRDFLGTDMDTLLTLIQLWTSFGEGEINETEWVGSYGRGSGLDTFEVFEVAAQSILTHGFRSTRADYGITTDYRVCKHFFSRNSEDHYKISDEAKELAIRVVKGFRESEGKDTFTQNIKSLIESGCTPYKYTAYICGCVFHFMMEEREAQRQAEYEAKKEARRQEEMKSEWIGSVGEKGRVFSAKFVNHTSFDSNFGLILMLFFVDENGNKIVWKTSSGTSASDVLWDENENARYGETFTFKATIKNHSVYKDVKQTEVTRVKIIG